MSMSDLVTRFQLAVAALRGRLQNAEAIQAQLDDCQLDDCQVEETA